MDSDSDSHNDRDMSGDRPCSVDDIMPNHTSAVKTASLVAAAASPEGSQASPLETHPLIGQNTSPCNNLNEILARLHQGQLMMVDRNRRNGLILYKRFHAEFAGPGAVVGSFFDVDCCNIIPVGDFSVLAPESHEERQNAFLIRRQWIKLTQQFTDESIPLRRAQMVLEQFQNYFGHKMTAQIPDEAFALLVGVMPRTVRMARRAPNKLNVKTKA